MEKLKVVDEVESRIERILSDRRDELARLDEQIEAEEIAIAAAENAMEAATAAGDLAAYQRAKADRTNAQDGREMHLKRKAALNDRPLISETEYKKAVADICAEAAAVDDQTKQKLTKLSDEMNAAGMILHDVLTRANDVLQRLQHDVFRDADRSRNPKSGEVLPIEHERAHVNADFYATCEWSRAGVSTGSYQRYTGRKG